MRVGKHPKRPPRARPTSSPNTPPAATVSPAPDVHTKTGGIKQRAIELPPTLPRDKKALAAFARTLEREAALAATRADKAAKLEDALLAWLAAASSEDAAGAGRTHGALANAAQVSERLASVTDAPGPRRIAQATALALAGDIDKAHAAFAAALLEPLSFPQARAARRALAVLDDARAVVQLDALALKLSQHQSYLAPLDIARSVAAEAEALALAHPRHALDFAALALEAHARVGDVAPHVGALVSFIQRAAHAQSATRTPAVAQKALLLATAQELAGNDKGARAAYLRVLEMSHATVREARAAHASLAKMAARRGDVEDARAHARQLFALSLAHHPSSSSASPLATRLGAARDPIAEIERALTPRDAGALGPAFTAAVDVAAIWPLAATAELPFELLFARGVDKQDARLPAGASDIAALIALRNRGVELLPALPSTRDLADDGTRLLGGLLKARRGETHTMTRAPLLRSFGVLAALAATDHRVAREAAATLPEGGAPSADAVAAASRHLASLIEDRTHGPASIDAARASLRALGWKPARRSSDLVKDGMRIRFEPFSIAGTAAFRARLEVNDGGRCVDAARTVHIGALGFSDDEWRLFEHGFEETIERYLKDLEHPHLAHKKAVDIDAVRRLVSLGRPVEEMPAKRADLAALAAKSARASKLLAELQQLGRAPKAIYVGVEGIDAASKTSNGMRIKSIAEENGYSGRWLSFKGPTAQERAQHWLLRYQKQAPKDGEVFLSDRTFLGDYAYNPSATPERMAEMAADVAAWQRRMRDDGVLVLNLLFDPRALDGQSQSDDVLERPMVTFGKREARALIARDLIERFRDQLSDAERASLEAACLGPGYNDLKSFHEGYDAMERFSSFASAIEAAAPEGPRFVRIGTKERQPGRVHALDALIAEFERLKAS